MNKELSILREAEKIIKQLYIKYANENDKFARQCNTTWADISLFNDAYERKLG